MFSLKLMGILTISVVYFNKDTEPSPLMHSCGLGFRTKLAFFGLTLHEHDPGLNIYSSYVHSPTHCELFRNEIMIMTNTVTTTP